MRPMIIFKEKNHQENYEFTQEEITKLLEQAYEAGVEDGKRQVNTIYVNNPQSLPAYPSTSPTPWQFDKIYCGNINTATSSADGNENIKAYSNNPFDHQQRVDIKDNGDGTSTATIIKG